MRSPITSSITIGELVHATYGPPAEKPRRKHTDEQVDAMPVLRAKALPPVKALAEMTKRAETVEIKPNVKLMSDGVLIEFFEETEFLLMTPRGARLLASKLVLAAEEAEHAGH